jgi:hypothetical protein
MSHPLDGEVFTPMTTAIVDMLEQLYLEYGRWRPVAEITGLRLKQVRAIRQGKHANGKYRKTISLTVMDRILTTTGVGHVNDYVWYTPEQLVDMGIWKAMG